MGGDGLGAGAGVALEGPDGGVPGPGEQHRGAGAVLGTGRERITNPVEYLSSQDGAMRLPALVAASLRLP
jgi:hypothetical protein